VPGAHGTAASDSRDAHDEVDNRFALLKFVR
jgi:hypothetical protein